jgi:23S rRNA pseudouridine1911/1915/1917 synthase
MLTNLHLDVRPDEQGMRLDRLVLSRCPAVPRAMLLEAMDAGGVSLNGLPAPKGRKVRAGDIVTVLEVAERDDNRVTANSAVGLCVLREDDTWVAVDKPAGVPVHPLDRRETDTLANALVARYPEMAAVGDQPLMPGVLHRIDTATSGVVLAARTAQAYARLREQFRRHTVRKIYLALVHGRLDRPGRVDVSLVHRRAESHRMETVPARRPEAGRALRAVTEYEPLEQGGGLTLLRVVILTGVTHQIRCHLASIGHPLVGDALYGGAPAHDTAARMHLHAAEIAFRHPVSGTPETVLCPAPPDFGLGSGR